MVDLDAFSGFLLALHRAERRLPADRFQDAVLDRLAAAVGFDAAWWGMAAFGRDDIRLHSSHAVGLPVDYDRRWLGVRHEDALARAIARRPGTTLRLDAAGLRRSPGLRSLVDTCGIRDALSTVVLEPVRGLATFLSLYRGSGAAPFGATERAFCQAAMPHIAEAWRGNRLTHLRRQAVAGGPRVARALADRRGVTHAADAGFRRLLRREWPDWRGPSLPAPLRRGAWYGASLVAERRVVGDLFQVELRPRPPGDCLTPRERAVADAYGRGASYKAVARDLDLAPSTVRHYLRNAYAKLGVSDKAALARCLADD